MECRATLEGGATLCGRVDGCNQLPNPLCLSASVLLSLAFSWAGFEGNAVRSESEIPDSDEVVSVPESTNGWTALFKAEDYWAIWLGALVLIVSLSAVLAQKPDDFANQLASAEQSGEALKLANPLSDWLAKPSGWVSNPLDAFSDSKTQKSLVPGLFGAFVCTMLLFTLARNAMTGRAAEFVVAFAPLFLLTIFAYVLSTQKVVNDYNLEYALWALVVGLLISNTIGTPRRLEPALCTELYIKTGLVILGAEVLLSELLALGIPGIFVSWVVTPIVLISTFLFGQRVLKISSPSLNMVISADMSVCGVSAAIATAAACKAKKEELSLAIGLSLAFTAVMMVVMPIFIKAVGMSEILGGAWMGGTIDSTGAVAAAGGVLGERALKAATTVKMIQNILIGVTAFGVSVYWVLVVERGESGRRPDAMEIWRRFPKFVLGFVAASIVFSAFYASATGGPEIWTAMKGSSGSVRGWCFALAFVSIGLETDFRKYRQYFEGGKPLVLYLVGQSLNLCLTLLMAWLMFEVVFRDQIDKLL